MKASAGEIISLFFYKQNDNSVVLSFQNLFPPILQTQTAYHFLMLSVAFHDIDPRRIDAGMTEQIRQALRYHGSDDKKRGGKQMAQIMRKYLFSVHLRRTAKMLHLCPDIGTVHRISVFGHENRSVCNPFFSAVSAQRPAEFFCQQHRALLPLAVHLRSARFQRTRRDKTQLGNAYTGSADCLKNKIKSAFSRIPGCLQETEIFLFRQLTVTVAEDTALTAQRYSIPPDR